MSQEQKNLGNFGNSDNANFINDIPVNAYTPLNMQILQYNAADSAWEADNVSASSIVSVNNIPSAGQGVYDHTILGQVFLKRVGDDGNATSVSTIAGPEIQVSTVIHNVAGNSLISSSTGGVTNIKGLISSDSTVNYTSSTNTLDLKVSNPLPPPSGVEGDILNIHAGVPHYSKSIDGNNSGYQFTNATMNVISNPASTTMAIIAAGVSDPSVSSMSQAPVIKLGCQSTNSSFYTIYDVTTNNITSSTNGNCVGKDHIISNGAGSHVVYSGTQINLPSVGPNMLLLTDGSDNVVGVDPTTGSNNIYNNDGLLNSDRTLTFQGHSFLLKEHGSLIYNSGVLSYDPSTPSWTMKSDGGEVDIGNITQNATNITSGTINFNSGTISTPSLVGPSAGPSAGFMAVDNSGLWSVQPTVTWTDYNNVVIFPVNVPPDTNSGYNDQGGNEFLMPSSPTIVFDVYIFSTNGVNTRVTFPNSALYLNNVYAGPVTVSVDQTNPSVNNIGGEMWVHFDTFGNANIVSLNGAWTVLGSKINSINEIQNLQNVDISSPVNAQLIKYNGGSGHFDNDFVALSELSDVSISGPTNGQLLTYNSGTSKWDNATLVIPPNTNPNNFSGYLPNALTSFGQAMLFYSTSYTGSKATWSYNMTVYATLNGDAGDAQSLVWDVCENSVNLAVTGLNYQIVPLRAGVSYVNSNSYQLQYSYVAGSKLLQLQLIKTNNNTGNTQPYYINVQRWDDGTQYSYTTPNVLSTPGSVSYSLSYPKDIYITYNGNATGPAQNTFTFTYYPGMELYIQFNFQILVAIPNITASLNCNLNGVVTLVTCNYYTSGLVTDIVNISCAEKKCFANTLLAAGQLNQLASINTLSFTSTSGTYTNCGYSISIIQRAF